MNRVTLLLTLICSIAWLPVAGADEVKTLKIHTLTAEEAVYNPANSRLGVMILARQSVYTIERPWIPNTAAPDGIGAGKPYESAVPLGDYDLVLMHSWKHGLQWHLENQDLGVFLQNGEGEHDWQRWGCMLHPANYMRQLLGCIAPGLSLADIDGDGVIDVTSSRAALVKVKGYLEGETRARLSIC